MCSEPREVCSRRAPRRRGAAFVLACLIALGLGGVLLPAAALALGLDEAKAQGLVGERPDGYVGAVKPDAAAEVKQLVEQVNAKRTELYARVAQQEGVSVVVVAARSGERLIQEARPGEYVLMGTWQKK